MTTLPADPAEVRRVFSQLGRMRRYLNMPGKDDMGEYVRALVSIPADLLEEAVSRWIMSPTKFFPFAGELRAMVADELSERSAYAFEKQRERTLADFRARGFAVIEAPRRSA